MICDLLGEQKKGGNPQQSQIMNFCKRSYQPILRYLYTEVIKRRGEISLHKHFNELLFS